jgi:mannose-6-phosphate isomerase-like protein (cupin superfamily)
MGCTELMTDNIRNRQNSDWLYSSFFLGGFECSNHLNVEGRRLDLIASTQHDRQAEGDYALCRSVGIRAVREAARWPRLDCRGVLQTHEVRELARLGRASGILQIWDLMHYGYPDDLDPFDPEPFVRRFADYAAAVAATVREESAGPRWYTPVNEISYYAWAGGEIGYMAPFGAGRGGELKRVLVRAAIEAVNAILKVDTDAWILSVDPLVRLHAPPGRQDLQPEADHFNHAVMTEAFDMLAGRIAPELGGSRAHLGVIGLNYYAGNQWTIGTAEQPQRFLDPADPLWVPLPVLLKELQARYGGPLVIAETGASGEARPGWLRHLIEEAVRARANGIDLQGICLYPIITSPDWEDPTAFFDGGLFDVDPQPDGVLRRVLFGPLAEALREGQAKLDPTNLPSEPLPAAEEQVRMKQPALLRPKEAVTFKKDNFSYRTLAAGEHLQVECYGLDPGAGVPAHRHRETEHVLTVIAGSAEVKLGGETVKMDEGEGVLVPAGLYYSIRNSGTGRLILQQVSGPKPWDAHYGRPHPSTLSDR